MTAVYSIKANGKDITGQVQQRLTSLEISDETGFRSDRVRICLDDRDAVFALPKTGARLDIRMGFREQDKAVVVHQGVFFVDEISCTGPPACLVIEGKASDMGAGLKEKKSRAWENVALADIVATIARAHDLAPVVGDELGQIRFAHLDQTDESDLHFLTRLGLEHDAVAKPVSSKLVLVKKGQARTASGKQLPMVVLDKKDFVAGGWDMYTRDRGKYGSVRAFFQDIPGGEKQSVTVGSDGPVYVIRSPFADRERAVRAAEFRLASLTRGISTLRGTVSARNGLFAEGLIRVTGIRSGVNGVWHLTRVVTRIDGTCLTVSFEATAPDLSNG